jgi:oxalate decarboxylase/phosphoglucose isomerase-like protein (cupin superfamily)
MPGDVGIVPRTMGHYVENLSQDEEVEMLEAFRAPRFEDFSLGQWLATTPDRMVSEHVFKDSPRAAKALTDALKAEKESVKAKL